MLETTVEQAGSETVMHLAGEMDLAESPRFSLEVSRLIDQDGTGVVLDLRHLTFLDSTGLRAIIRADRYAQEAGCTLRLIAGPERVQRIFELTRLDDRLTFVDAEEIFP